jgi:hypothetical protein
MALAGGEQKDNSQYEPYECLEMYAAAMFEELQHTPHKLRL